MERKSMNDPHKFGTEFGSDNAPEHSAAIVGHHDSIKWSARPGISDLPKLDYDAPAILGPPGSGGRPATNSALRSKSPELPLKSSRGAGHAPLCLAKSTPSADGPNSSFVPSPDPSA